MSALPVPFRLRRLMLATIGVAVLLIVANVPTAHGADKAAVKKSIARGVDYLTKLLPQEENEGYRTLLAYAIIKGGGNKQHPEVQKVIGEIVTRSSDGSYTGHSSNVDRLYAGAIEAMILADVGPEKYKGNLQTIVNYFVENQRPNGCWDYHDPNSVVGDTSVTQYGSLGLWAGVLAGAEVPLESWDRLLSFHYETQFDDGGFAYAIGNTTGPGGGRPTGSMAAAAIASMTIAAMFLYPDKMAEMTGLSAGGSNTAASTKKEDDPFGFLKKKAKEKANEPSGPYRPKNTFESYLAHMRKTLGWLNANHTLDYKVGPQMYYYYSIERMGALTDTAQVGGADWFDQISDRLLQSQRPDGSWDLDYLDGRKEPYPVGTSFGVLFLSRSTAKLLNRVAPPDPIGGGIQAGGRGLPDDLSAVKMQDGRVAKDESLGPLDDLLKSLESAASDDLFNLQTQIVKKIQLGDRSELIGQTDRLISLLEYPSPEIRRTALWALARSDDLKMARHAVNALQDPDADVVIEAHAALCWLSRRPNAFDLPMSPFTDLPPDATDEQKAEAFGKWRDEALNKWGRWYLRMIPYEERNDPFAFDLARKIGAR